MKKAKKAMRDILKVWLFMVLGIPATLSYSQEIPESFVPIRPKGIGGAFTAVANDDDSVWTNPAGIARMRKARSRSTVNRIKIPGIIAGANTSSQAFMKAIDSDASTAAEIAAQTKDVNDKPFWAATQASPLIMFDVDKIPIVLGGYTSTVLRSAVNNDNSELANTEAKSDIGGLFGFAYTSQSNRFNIGVQGRYVARYAFEEKVPLTTLADANALQNLLKEQSNRSSALALDLGMLWTFADFWFPTIGIAVLNAPLGCKENYLNPFSKTRVTTCGTVFTGSFANEEAISTVDPTDIRMGISLMPRLAQKFSARIALDVHHLALEGGGNVYGLSGIDVTKLLHAGIEFFWGNPLLPPPFTFGFGINQGYYTFGTTLRLGVLALSFSSYGEDISTSTSPVEDRRLLLGLSLDF